MRRPILLIATAAAGAAILTGVAACGSSGSSAGASTAATSPAATAPADTTEAQTVDVVMGAPKEFSLVPTPGSATAGQVTFRVTNNGTMPHEFVVLRTTAKAADLPTSADGEAKEDGAVGEIPDLAPGATKSVVLALKAGHYSLICNLPGHYAGGMYADLTVS